VSLPPDLSDEDKSWIARRSCTLKILAAGGAAFLAIAETSENLVRYLYVPGWLWIVGGTYLAGLWAYESLCIGDPPK
jgi:hypothetical protein